MNAKESTGERKDDFEMKGKPIGPPPFNKTLIESLEKNMVVLSSKGALIGPYVR